jgi:hypothetical protein
MLFKEVIGIYSEICAKLINTHYVGRSYRDWVFNRMIRSYDDQKTSKGWWSWPHAFRAFSFNFHVT